MMETTIMSQKDMLTLKNTVTEMKNFFNVLISKLDTDEKELMNSRPIETS